MVRYPIRISRNGYRGSNPSKRQKTNDENQIIATLENEINEMLLTQKEPICVYTYHEIAENTGFFLETVEQHCFCIDGGHNGFTALRGQLTLDEAKAEMCKA